MRLLLLADREPRPSVRALLAAHDVDAVIGLGDLQPSWIEALADARVPKFGVYGNHDEADYMPTLGMDDLHLSEATIGGLVFTGFEGCVRYRRDGGPYQYTQREGTKMARKLPAAEVLVAHCPPLGINDDPDDPAHIGWAGLRGWIERHEPRHLLHGHTHPVGGRVMTEFGRTQVHWISGARVLSL
jgi:uncharacterized protein